LELGGGSHVQVGFDPSTELAHGSRKAAISAEQVDVHAGDLSGGKLLDAIKAMGRYAVRGVRLIEMAKGRAQETVGAFGSEPLGLMHYFV